MYECLKREKSLESLKWIKHSGNLVYTYILQKHRCIKQMKENQATSYIIGAKFISLPFFFFLLFCDKHVYIPIKIFFC